MIQERENAGKKTANLLKVIAHPVRLRILAILRAGEECVCHMEAVLGLRQAYISQHLTVLREAGLVSVRREGWNVFYRVAVAGVFDVIAAASQIAAGDSEGRALLARPRPRKCPCPKCSHESQVKIENVGLPRKVN